jgi:hypothetical protein
MNELKVNYEWTLTKLKVIMLMIVMPINASIHDITSSFSNEFHKKWP